MINAFIACQIFVVLFIAFHDWIPLGKLNNLAGIRAVDSLGKRVIATVLSTLPFAICLAGSIYYASTTFPGWLNWFLWISYGACCALSAAIQPNACFSADAKRDQARYAACRLPCRLPRAGRAAGQDHPRRIGARRSARGRRLWPATVYNRTAASIQNESKGVRL
jgi:hypothetical protein